LQSQVPQFIEVEDKVVGPLTIKQTLYLAVGGLIIFALWFLIDNLALFILASLPIALISAGLAFLKINGRPFVHFLFNIFGYTKTPKVMLWQRKANARKKVLKSKTKPENNSQPIQINNQQSLIIEQKRKSKIKDLAKAIDISK